MRIWKFPLQMMDKQWVSMPKGAQILSAQVQDHALFLWALVDETCPKDQYEYRCLYIYATGEDIEGYPGKYISTIQSAGWLVFHIFEMDS